MVFCSMMHACSLSPGLFTFLSVHSELTFVQGSLASEKVQQFWGRSHGSGAALQMRLGPAFSWGGSCRDRSQKCVFTFIMCFPKLSSRQLKFRFLAKKGELFQPPELSLELEDTEWIADISGMSIVLKWNMKVSTPGSHTASAVCPNRQKWSRALLLGACTYELTDMSRDDRALLTLVCVWKPGMLPKLKPEKLDRPPGGRLGWR